MDVIVPLPDLASLPEILQMSPHWIVWKAEVREGKIAKIPCDRAGETDSMKSNHMDISGAIAAAERLRKLYGNQMFGVGLSFTEDSEVVGVDLDAALANGQRADHLAWMLGNYPTWSEVSLSGVGAHLFYRGKFSGKRNALIDEKRFEIFGTKGFIAVTGRQIPDTPEQAVSFQEASQALEPFLEEFQPAPVEDRNGVIHFPFVGSRYGEIALDNQCERVKSAPSGGLHYAVCKAAASIGKLVPHIIPYNTAFESLYAAAEIGGGKDMARAARTINGQLEWGMADPAYPKPREEYPEIDLSDFGKPREESCEESLPEVADPGPFPEHLLDVPGFIEEVSQFTNQNSFILQPILALGGALALLAVLTGRKIQDKDGTRTNVYILSVAGSGEGKDMARKTNKRALFAAGAGPMVGPESWASGSGLLASVEKQPAILFQNDEIGRFLQMTGDAKRSPHLFTVVSILLKLYSSSNDVFLGDAYSDCRQKTIAQPHAVLFGTTVPGSLYAALSEDSITNGLMSRLLIFEAPERQGASQDPETSEPPESILEVVRQWARWQPGSGNLQNENPTPHVVNVTPDAERQFRALRAESRDQRAILGDVLGSLWVRSVENARKLALLYACSANFGIEAVVEGKAAAWSCELVKYLVKRQCFIASKHIARNQIEATSLEVERLICESANGLTTVQLFQRTRHLNRRDRLEIVGSLLDVGRIKQDKIQTKGRPRTVYKRP